MAWPFVMCETFCQCRRKSDQSRCLADCRACRDEGGRLHGKCGDYFCCYPGDSSCGSYCADLAADPYNCGDCGYERAPPGRWEEGACIDGRCEYWCANGAIACDGVCTVLDLDGNNCGACGYARPAEAPFCAWGICSECPAGHSLCDGWCVDLNYDNYNCGACGYVCPGSHDNCDGGVCVDGGGPWVDPGPSP